MVERKYVSKESFKKIGKKQKSHITEAKSKVADTGQARLTEWERQRQNFKGNQEAGD